MPLNSPPHAIHGTARDGAWRTARERADEAVLTYELADPWPLHRPGHADRSARRGQPDADACPWRRTRIRSRRRSAGTPGSTGTSGGGRTCGSTSTPAWQEERGEDHLPTGRRIEPRPGPWDDCFGMPDGVDVRLTWPGQLELKVTSREQWVVVYDEQDAAVCVEPQSGPPNGLNTAPRLVTPLEPLEASTTWSWRRL